MLHFRVPSRLVKGLVIHHKWFSSKPLFADAFRFAQYYHCIHQGPVRGFSWKPKFTILIDLTMPEAAILGSFSENTRYKIKRAARENVRMELETELENFCSFLNASADTKGRGHIDVSGLTPFRQRLHITKAVVGNETFAMHSYLFDDKIGRVVLYHSASLFRLEKDSQKRNLIGRANRWLHFQDMLLFKQLGATLYDFGGYAKDSVCAEQVRINQFKAGFGGSLVEESNYISNVVLWWNTIRGNSVST